MGDAQIVSVKGTKDDGSVVLWEQHNEHPGGEIYVTNNGEAVKAARTSLVNRKINDGDLVIVDDAKSDAAAEAPAEDVASSDDSSEPAADVAAEPAADVAAEPAADATDTFEEFTADDAASDDPDKPKRGRPRKTA